MVFIQIKMGARNGALLTPFRANGALPSYVVISACMCALS